MTPTSPLPPAMSNWDNEEVMLAYVDEVFPNRVHPPGQRPTDLADYKHGPVCLHERWQQRLASGDPYALAVAAACDRWQAEQDAQRLARKAQREIRRLKHEYKEALGRNDSKEASRLFFAIRRAEADNRDARSGQE